MKRAAAVTAALALAGLGVVGWRERSRSRSPSTTVGDTSAPSDGAAVASPAPQLPAAPPPVVPPPVPAAAAARRDDRPGLSERALMATLRELGSSSPEQSIELARDGQRRFPDSGDASERAYTIVRSLVNLRRFHEARDEAREMVRKYPDNPLTLDAQRHLLVYPLDQPSREAMQGRDQ